MPEKPEITTLNRLLANMTVYSNPDLLLKEFTQGIDFNAADQNGIKKYQGFLTEIKWAHEKVLKYPVYFSEFYSQSENIPDHEALEHNIHSYIEDLNILRNKIHVFLGNLKNDLKKVAENKEEIEEALKFATNQIYEVFQKVSDTRNPHNHGTKRVKDGDIVDVEFARMAQDVNFPLRERFKPEFLEELKKRENESFEKAKAKWVEMAKNNSIQTSGLVEEVMNRNKNFLYQLLDMKPLDF